MKDRWTRRRFLMAAAAAGAGANLLARGAAEVKKPALLGGSPVRKNPFP